MEYVVPLSNPAGVDGYQDRDVAAGKKGSGVPAASIEHPQREIVAAIAAAGLTPDSGDLAQLAQALLLMRNDQYDFSSTILANFPLTAGATQIVTAYGSPSGSAAGSFAGGAFTVAAGMAGTWVLTAHSHLNGTVTNPFLTMYVNGLLRAHGNRAGSLATSHQAMGIVTSIIVLNVGDVVTIGAHIDTGACDITLGHFQGGRISK